MGFLLGYLIFVVLFAAGNGWEAVFDPSSLFGFVHILFWVTISGAVLSLMSFVFKSWGRAIVSAGMCYASVLLWNYLLECRI